MAFFVRLPRAPSIQAPEAAQEHYLNIINGDGTLGQRELRRNGYAGYELPTAATCCAMFELLARGLLPGYGKARTASSTSERPGSAASLFTFYDIGANGGHYTFLCKGLYREKAHVVSFEPAPNSYTWLQAINQANRFGVYTENMALSDQPGTATLYLSSKSDASNSLNPGFRHHAGEVQVACSTLDDYCHQRGWFPDFIKLDTETHEAEVLRGGLRMLQAQRPYFVVECLHSGGVDYGEAVAEVMQQLGGYHFYHIGKGGALEEHGRIATRAETELRDWILSPAPLPAETRSVIEHWSGLLRECTPALHVTPGKPSRATKASPSKGRPEVQSQQALGEGEAVHQAAAAAAGPAASAVTTPAAVEAATAAKEEQGTDSTAPRSSAVG